MKKQIKFCKGFIPSAIISGVIIILGIVGFFTKGINFGIDFKPGLIEEVRVAPPVAEITYDGPAKINIELSAGQMDVIISGLGATNETRSFNFGQIRTVAELANEVNKIDGIKMIVNDGGFDTTKLFLNSIASNILSKDALYIYPAGTSDITTDDIRTALASKAGINVKQLGEGSDASYQIRVGLSADESQNDILEGVNDSLYNYFGKEKSSRAFPQWQRRLVRFYEKRRAYGGFEKTRGRVVEYLCRG
jgi:preprotein translocase subunit SecF